MSVASEYTEDGGNEQLTLQQPESTGSLPKYTVTFDSETKLGMLLERRAAFAGRDVRAEEGAASRPS